MKRVVLALLIFLSASAEAAPSSDALLLDTANMMTVFRGVCLQSITDDAKAADMAAKLQMKVATEETRKLLNAKDGEKTWEMITPIRLQLPSGEKNDGRYYLSLSKPWTCQVRAMSADPEALRNSVQKLFGDMQAQARDIPFKQRLDKTMDAGNAKVRQTEWVYGSLLIYAYTITGCPNCVPHMVGLTSMTAAK